MSPALPRRIAILLHERDRRAEARPYQVWGLADLWRREGVEVVPLRGARRFVEADVVVNHVDLTVVPAPYAALLARYRVAVNGRVTDISKRRVSANLVARGDGWSGPVIVKSDLNCGGRRERQILRGALGRRLDDLRLAIARRPWAVRKTLATDDYLVLPSVAEVPDGAWENPALVVERFLPEVVDGLYAVRTWSFLGDRGICRRVFAREPTVKAARRVRFEEVEPHADAIDAARRLGLEHGKVDYVVHDGRVVVLDLNRTPTFGPTTPPDLRASICARLAPGLDALLRPA